MNLKGITGARVSGLAADADELRAIMGALHLAGHSNDLRVGMVGDDFVWRTPVLGAAQLEAFIHSTGIVVIGAARSASTPSHLNVLAAIA